MCWAFLWMFRLPYYYIIIIYYYTKNFWQLNWCYTSQNYITGKLKGMLKIIMWTELRPRTFASNFVTESAIVCERMIDLRYDIGLMGQGCRVRQLRRIDKRLETRRRCQQSSITATAWLRSNIGLRLFNLKHSHRWATRGREDIQYRGGR